MKFLAIIVSIILGIIFLLSAYTKLYPIEPFEYTFVELGIGGWTSSIFIARLFIGLEFACGLLLIGNLLLKRFTIPLVATVLIFFCVYLLFEIAVFGNSGNCGCFGNYFQFTPLQAILKNIIMLLALAYVYYFHQPLNFCGMKILLAFILIGSLIIPFVLNPVDLQVSHQSYTGDVNYKLPLDILYTSKQNAPPKIDLRKGKHIIAFLSLTCPHCRVAAKKLHVMKVKNPSLPIYMVLNGKSQHLKEFFDDTRAANIEWSQFNGAKEFIQMAGLNLPVIDWVNNSIVVRKSTYFTLNQSDIESWLNRK
jgi:hypothetical protein